MSSGPPQLSILLIDDSPFSARHIERILVADGYAQCVWAPSVEEGLALAAQIRPALFLLDPALTGNAGRLVACCRELVAAAGPGRPARAHPAQPDGGV